MSPIISYLLVGLFAFIVIHLTQTVGNTNPELLL